MARQTAAQFGSLRFAPTAVTSSVSRKKNMLSTKEIYNASIHNLSLVQWAKVGGGEWVFVGDSDCFRGDIFLSVLEQLFSTEQVYVVQSRHVAIECSFIDAVNFTREGLRSGTILVCSRNFSKYVQVEPMGVYRCGVLRLTK